MDQKTNTHSNPVLILGAMDEEIQALLELLQHAEADDWHGFKLHFGTIDDQEVIICKSGIGKVFASIITQHLIDRYALKAVLFTGVAGAIASDLSPGDIIIGDSLVHHDFDVGGLGFEIGHIPFTDYRFFKSAPQLLEQALSNTTEFNNTVVRTGRIGTGDQFVMDKSKIPELKIDCVDMEGAAVAQVCTVNDIPFLIIRIISDKADGSAHDDFGANLPKYSHRSIQILRSVLNAV